MSSEKERAQQYMDSPLVAWVRTFDDYNTVETVEDLADGILLNKVMYTVDATAYGMSKVNRSVARDPSLRLQNLQLLVTRIKHFYLTRLQQLVIASLPNISVISHTPEINYSLDEMEKLLILLLGCVVQCEGKVPLIERMKSMDLHQQQALVIHIQTMTDTTDYVCSIDWNDLEEISKPNLEGLCRTAYIHLQRVAKERDHHYETLCDLLLERDYYKQLQAQSANDSLPHENGLPITSPSKSPAVNVEVLELKKKCRQLQEQLDRKVEMVTDMKDDLEQSRANIQRLQQEKRDLMEDAKSVRVFRDEIETLKVQAAKVEKLEADVMKYRQRAEDAEYLRKRIADLKQQNELMLETKSLLEQKAASLLSRTEAVDDLETELAALRVQLDSVNQEKEMDLERIEELLGQNAQLELDARHCQEQIEYLMSSLEAEREKSISAEVSSGGEASNLSFEMNEADLASKAKVLRLEKEARELERTMEQLRHSQAKVSELEKTNKKLYSQTHSDRKEIIKLKEEVEVLKVKASRVDKLQTELNTLRERREEVSRLSARIKDLKTRKEAVLEAKAKLEDEVESLQSKVALLDVIKDENASLKAHVEALVSDHDEDQKRLQELLEQNAQLELKTQKFSEERSTIQAELAVQRSKSGGNAPITVLSPPRISESEMASRAKLQRLEKETREMEKTMEEVRHSQAKMAELEKTNKRLQEQTHADRRENIRIKEEIQAMKAKANRMNRLETEIKSQEHKLEDIDAARRKVTELKQQNALLSESKVLLQEEMSSVQSKLERLNELHAENAALTVRVDTMEAELKEESTRNEELLQQNAQLEVDKDSWVVQTKALTQEIERLRSSNTVSPEVPFSPAGHVMSDTVFASQTKVLHLEKENRELERSLQVLKQSSERAAAERETMQKRLNSQIHEYRKDVAKLKEELRQARNQSTGLHARLTRLKSVDGEHDQTRQFQELESRFSEAYSQSLTTKDERIRVLEKRLDETTSESQNLREEVGTLRRHSDKVRRTSPAGSPAITRTLSPRDLNRLRDQAADAMRLREKLHMLQDENHHLRGDLLDAKAIIERHEQSNSRLADRIQMFEQLNHTLEEEKKTLLLQINRLLEQNQGLLMRTLESKDDAIQDERIFNDRLGELERDKVRLSERLAAQQREHLAREMDYLKKSKSKNLLKKGFKKLKGKIQQGRTHTFEPMDGSIGGSQQGLSSSVNLGSPREPLGLGLPPYSINDGSMSSSQSISSSNSGRHSDGLEDLQEGPEGLVPRAPTMDGSPFLRPRKGRSYTLPAGIARPHVSASPSIQPETVDDLMSLEDFLAESDKTPNRRRVMELKRASLVLNTPPMTPRNSLHISSSAATGSVGGQLFDIQEFLSHFDSEGDQLAIPEVEETESEQHFLGQPMSEFQPSQPSQHSSTSALSQHDDLSSQGATPVRLESSQSGNSNNNNSNNNNNNNSGMAVMVTGDAATDDKDGLVSSTPTSTSCEQPTATSWGNASSISMTSNHRSSGKKTLRVESSLGTDVVYPMPDPSEKHRVNFRVENKKESRLRVPTASPAIPKSRSSENLRREDPKGKERRKSSKLTKKKAFHRSSEDILDSDVLDKKPKGKPPLLRRRPHKSSSDVMTDQKGGGGGRGSLAVEDRARPRAGSTGAARTSLSGLTDLSQTEEVKISFGGGKSKKSQKRRSMPVWAFRASPLVPSKLPHSPQEPEVPHVPPQDPEVIHVPSSPNSEEDTVWSDYGKI